MEINCRVLARPRGNATIGKICYIRSIITLTSNYCGTHILKIRNSKFHKEFVINNNIEKTFENHIYDGLGSISFKNPPFDILLQSKKVRELEALFKRICTYKSEKIRNLLPSSSSGTEKIIQNTALTMVKSTKISNKPTPMSLVVTDYSDCIKKDQLTNTLTSIMIMDGALKPTTPLDTLSTLENLHTIYITNNCIDVIPESFGNLRLFEVTLINNNFGKNFNWNWLKRKTIQNSLVKLDLSQNKINVFPKAILNCTKLNELRLSKNSIRRIPYEIRCLKSLSILDVSDNILEALPYSLKRIKLNSLNYSGNSPADIINKPICVLNNKFPSLLLLATRAVTYYKLKFNNKTLPQTLIDTLLQSPICICGQLAFYDYSAFVFLKLNSISTHLTYSGTSGPSAIQQVFCCSQKCLLQFFVYVPKKVTTRRLAIIYNLTN